MLLKATSNEDEARILKSSSSREIIPLLENDSLIQVEIALQKHVFKRILLFSHQNPLSVSVIFGYLFAKEIEIMNLKKIVKAKYLGIPADKLEPMLVTA